MRTLLCLAIMALTWANTAYAQIKIDETITTNAGQEVYFDLDHPDVTFTTWDKNEIQIKGTASVNNGKNDDAFQFSVDRSGGEIYIETDVENECNLPKMISGTKDGKRIYLGTTKKGFNWNSIKEEYEGELDNISIGVLVESKLEVMIPKNIALKVETRFGDVVINDFDNKLIVKSTHGSIDAIFSKVPSRAVKLSSTHNHVDVSIPKTAKLDMELKTSHGEILTNLDLEMNGSDGRGGRNKNACSSNKNNISATLNGGGTEMQLVATHNIVYLRELK